MGHTAEPNVAASSPKTVRDEPNPSKSKHPHREVFLSLEHPADTRGFNEDELLQCAPVGRVDPGAKEPCNGDEGCARQCGQVCLPRFSQQNGWMDQGCHRKPPEMAMAVLKDSEK